MTTRSPSSKGASAIRAPDQWNKPIPKVLRVDDVPGQTTEDLVFVEKMPLVSHVKSEWPSVSSKSKKALPAPKYQFYYGDSTEPRKKQTKTIRVPMEQFNDLGAWAKGADDRQ